MASVKDLNKVFDDLEGLLGELRDEVKNGPDFSRLVQLLDEVSEHADNAAGTFNAMNDALMNRLNELKGKAGSSGKSDGSSSQTREKSGAAS